MWKKHTGQLPHSNNSEPCKVGLRKTLTVTRIHQTGARAVRQVGVDQFAGAGGFRRGLGGASEGDRGDLNMQLVPWSKWGSSLQDIAFDIRPKSFGNQNLEYKESNSRNTHRPYMSNEMKPVLIFEMKSKLA